MIWYTLMACMVTELLLLPRETGVTMEIAIMIDQEAVVSVLQSIDDVAEFHRLAPAAILTEADLEFRLAMQLCMQERYRGVSHTRDSGVVGAHVHAQLSWWNAARKLRMKPDLTITDAGNLSILPSMEPGVQTPAKGCRFNGPAIIVELKFWHDSGQFDGRFRRAIADDAKKIRTLIDLHRNDGNRNFLNGVMVVFTRYGVVSSRLEEVQSVIGCANDQDIHVVVRSADLL